MNCTDDKQFWEFQIITGLSIFTGVLTVICGIIVLTVLILFKKYHFHNQRLIMYLNVCVIIQGIVSATNVNTLLPAAVDLEAIQDSTLCSVYGFLNNYAIYIQLLMIWWITIDIFLLSVFRIHVSNKFEMVQIFTTFFLPLTFLWIPLLSQINQYGPDGPICDIQIIDYSSCERIHTGTVTWVVLRLIPLVLSMITIISLYIIVIVKLKKERNQYKGVYDPSHQKEVDDLIKRTRVLLAYPIIYFLFSIPNVIKHFSEFFNNEQEFIAFFALSVLASNLRGAAISLAFTFDCATLGRLKTLNMISLWHSQRNSAIINSYADSNLYMSYGDSLDAKEYKAKNNKDTYEIWKD